MASKTKTSPEIKIRRARLSFPVLWTPKPFREGQVPRFEATFLLDPTNADHKATIREMKQAIAKLAQEAYGDIPPEILDGSAVALHNNVVSTINQETKAVITSQQKKYAGYKDMYYLVSAQPCEVVDRKAKPVVPKVTYLPNGQIDSYVGQPPVIGKKRQPVREGQPEAPYGGCYVNAIVSFWAQQLSAGFGPRINCNLLAVQFAADGESFGRGGIDVDSNFEAIEDSPTTTDQLPAGVRASAGFLDV